MWSSPLLKEFPWETRGKISQAHGDFFKFKFYFSREDSLRHFLCVSSTLLSEQFYNRPQTFQSDSLLLWVGLWAHWSPHLLVFSPWFSFLLRLQEGVDWTSVIGFQIEDPPWCFLLGSMIQWSEEPGSFEEEVHSEFSEPQTSNCGPLTTHPEDNGHTPLLYLPSSSPHPATSSGPP